jgi:hypothetical protein
VPVAVIVIAITDLGGAGVDAVIRIVTVATSGGIALGRAGGCDGVAGIAIAIPIGIPVISRAPFIHVPVAVVIDVITAFRGPWMYMGIMIVTVIVGWITVEIIV